MAIRPLNVEFTQLYTNDISLSNALSRIIQPGRTVSEILNEWPGTFPVLTSIAPMLIWVTPRTGVINVEGENWLFQMHGTNELALQKLPLQLQTDVIGRIEKEGPSVLSDVFDSAWETELTTCLDITYLPGGRIDGVRPLSTWLYAQSTDNKFANLSEEEHKMQLSLLVEQGKLKEWLGHYFLVERSV